MSNATMDTLVKALLDGDQSGTAAGAGELRDAGVGSERIITVTIQCRY
jgi:hypothetical protein